MLSAQVERLSLAMPELKVAFPEHWAELALDRDKVPLDPDFAAYEAADMAGRVLFVALREAGELAGYFVGFVGPHLHYRSCVTLTMDIFYLRPAWRDGRPRAALTLFREVERAARARGVKRWIVGSKLHRDSGPASARSTGGTPRRSLWAGGR